MRFALILLVMFAIPFIVFAVWRLIRGDKAQLIPTHVLVLMGAFLSVLAMLLLALSSIDGDENPGVYEPTRLEDGQIRPGGFEDEGDEPVDEPPNPTSP